MSDQNTKPDNINQIREIIFGEQMKFYTSKFEEMDKKLKDMKKSFDKEILSVRQMLDHLRDDLKENKAEIGSSLSGEIKEIKNQIYPQLEKINKNLEQLDRKKSDQKQLAQIIQNLGKQLENNSDPGERQDRFSINAENKYKNNHTGSTAATQDDSAE